jgi:hypothetical protein
LSASRTGPALNPNYAQAAVLQVLPGMTQEMLVTILEARRNSIFRNVEEFRSRMGLPAESPLLRRLTFGRGTSPAIRVTAHVEGVTRIATERRVRTQTVDRRRAIPTRFVSLIQRHNLLN